MGQPKLLMKATLQFSEGYHNAFDLILVNEDEVEGENDNHTNVQIEDSNDQIHLAQILGCKFYQKNGKLIPHPEGKHGIAYDFLKNNINTTFNKPDGFFD